MNAAPDAPVRKPVAEADDYGPQGKLRSTMKLRRTVVLTVVAGLALVAVLVTNALSATAQGVRVEVVPADRYCTLGAGGEPMTCHRTYGGLFPVRGAKNQWLVIFTFVAPRSTAFPGPYYLFRVRGPLGCGNAIQFGAAGPGAVRKGQRVVSSATFAKGCPGLGRGTISLIRKTGHPFPIMAVGRVVAGFKFTIP